MQEEVTRGAVTLIVDGAKLSEQVFEKAVKKFLEEIQTIKVKAHEGDPDAIDTVLSHYAGYIRYCSKVHGKVNAEVEEYVKQKLIAALFKFRFDR